MATGKIRIKRIEDMKKRQITYANRRKILFKKANELASLCDVKVSIIMISYNGKLHEYISPSTTTKQMLVLYQKIHGIDLWSSHYERMEERLKELQATNKSLKEQISKRKGECLSNLNFDELRTLDREMEDALKTLRERRVFKIRTQVEVLKKKLRYLEVINGVLLTDLGIADDPDHGVVDNRGVYDYGIPREPNQAAETETKSVLTSCSTSNCSVNLQPNDVDDETESGHASS